MRIEEHEDYCVICEKLVPDGGTHSDEKHGSGRYGVNGDLRRKSAETEGENRMSEFKADIEAIGAWGQATHEAILKGTRPPKLSLPSCHKPLDRQEEQSRVFAQPQDDSQVLRP